MSQSKTKPKDDGSKRKSRNVRSSTQRTSTEQNRAVLLNSRRTELSHIRRSSACRSKESPTTNERVKLIQTSTDSRTKKETKTSKESKTKKEGKCKGSKESLCRDSQDLQSKDTQPSTECTLTREAKTNKETKTTKESRMSKLERTSKESENSREKKKSNALKRTIRDDLNKEISPTKDNVTKTSWRRKTRLAPPPNPDGESNQEPSTHSEMPTLMGILSIEKDEAPSDHRRVEPKDPPGDGSLPEL